MKQQTVMLLGVLVVVVVAAVAEYTVGGGWHQIANRATGARTKPLAAHTFPLLKLPDPMGRKDAPARFEFFIKPCPRLQSKVAGIVNAFWSMQDKAYVIFATPTQEMEPKPVAGKTVLCEMQARINGLETLKVPWREQPVISGRLGAADITDAEYKRLVEWLTTPEGQASVKQQLEAEGKTKGAK
jgi:hypothetical protein